MPNQFTTHSIEINSLFLKQIRTINCCIPKGFENVELPLLFLLDGGEDEKLPFVLEKISTLLEANKIKPFIIIGIENKDRNFDFTHHTSVRKDRKWVPKFGNATRFKRFIAEELIPTIDAQYKTTESRTIIGESLGGLLVLDFMLNDSDLFQQYIALDPSLWWNNQILLYLFKSQLEEEKVSDLKLWLSSSGTQAIKIGTDALDEILHNKLKSYTYHIDLNQTHFTIFENDFSSAILWTFKR